MLTVGEYGVVIRVNVGIDVSEYTSISLIFTKPSGAVLEVENPLVYVPSTDVNTNLGVFYGKKYCEYSFKEGDLDQCGNWTVRVVYVDQSKKLISPIKNFTVSQ